MSGATVRGTRRHAIGCARLASDDEGPNDPVTSEPNGQHYRALVQRWSGEDRAE